MHLRTPLSCLSSHWTLYSKISCVVRQALTVFYTGYGREYLHKRMRSCTLPSKGKKGISNALSIGLTLFSFGRQHIPFKHIYSLPLGHRPKDILLVYTLPVPLLYRPRRSGPGGRRPPATPGGGGGGGSLVFAPDSWWPPLAGVPPVALCTARASRCRAVTPATATSPKTPASPSHRPTSQHRAVVCVSPNGLHRQHGNTTARKVHAMTNKHKMHAHTP